MKRPAFMFYPADWRKDSELRVCSIAARGLWIDMIAIMHESDPYGHLAINGAQVSDVQLARLIGESPAKTRGLLAELEGHNVFSRNDNGVIFSRRMVADEALRNTRAECGKLGGNPKLNGTKKDKQTDKQTVKQILTPSVAVAVAVSNSGAETTKATTSRRKKRDEPDVPRETWLTPASEVYEQRNGPGSFSFPEAGRALKQLREPLGADEIGRRLGIYLDQTPPEFQNLHKFAKTHARYAAVPAPELTREQQGWFDAAMREQRLEYPELYNPDGSRKVA